MSVTTYYFDVLRLTVEYILGENSFCSVILFLLKCFGCYNFSISIFLPQNVRETITVPKVGRGQGI